MSEPAVAIPAYESLPACPFPGIEAFTYARHRVFFARDEEIRLLTRTIVLHRGVLLYAASGTGKSSLINAGIIPQAIEEGLQPERIRVQPKVGQEIVVEPIRAFTDERPGNLPSIFIEANQQSERLVLSVEEFLNRVLSAGDVRPLLIFDQFEEWVTLFDEPSTEENRVLLNRSRVAIQSAISQLINHRTLPVKVLIALREDYLANLAPLFRDVPSLPDNYLRLKALSSKQLTDVIRKPYERYPGAFAVEFTPALAARIRAQFEERVAGGDIQLTEVQIVCRTLFEYAANGGDPETLFAEKGVQGILEAYLETTLDALEPEAREPAVAVLSRLITSSGTRNVVSEDNLIRWLGTEEMIPPETVRTGVRNLEHRARLIRCEPRRGVNYYEINSEFLVPRIQREAIARETTRQVRELGRIEEEKHRQFRQKLRLRITSAVAAVVLFLAVAALVRSQTQSKMRLHSDAEAVAVRSLMDSGEIGKVLAAQAEAIHSKEDTGHFSGLVGTALVTALSTPLAPLWRFPDAVGSVSQDGAGRFLAATSAGRVFLWDLRRPRNDPKEIGEDEPALFETVSLSRDGTKLVAGASDGEVFLWSLTGAGSDATRFRGGSGAIFSVDISPDGRHVAAANRDGTVRLWDVRTGQGSGKSRYTGGRVAWSVRFSDDGNTVFVGSVTGGIQRLDLGLERVLDTLPGVSVAFSTDGRWMASGDMHGEIRVWRTSNLRIPPERRFAAYGGPVRSVALSRDGSALVSAGDSTIQVWDLIPNPAVRTLRAKSKGLPAVAIFSGDGNSLFSGGTDGELKWWRNVRGKNGYPLIVSPPRQALGTVTSAAISVTSQRVAMAVVPQKRSGIEPGARDSTAEAGRSEGVWVYDFRGDNGSLIFPTGSASEVAIASSADGRSLAVAGSDGIVRFQRTDDRLPTEVGFGHANYGITSVALSADGQRLAGNANDKIVRVWNTKRPAANPLQLIGSTAKIRALAFSRDGRRLASGGEDGTVRVWTIPPADSSPGSRAPITFALEFEAHDEPVGVLAFSPNGTLLASGGENGKVSIWDVAGSRKLVVAFIAGESAVTSLLFGTDSRLVFAGSSDGTIRFWSVGEGNASPVLLNAPSGAVRAIALSASADTLYAVGDNGGIRAWLINRRSLARRLCQQVTNNLSFDQWRVFVPADLKYELTCPEWRTPRGNIDAIKRAIRQEDVAGAWRLRAQIGKLDSSQTYDVRAGIMFYQAEKMAAHDGPPDSAVTLARAAAAAASGDTMEVREGLERVGAALFSRATVLVDSGNLKQASGLMRQVFAIAPAGSTLTSKTIPASTRSVFLDPSDSLARHGLVDSALVMLGQARTLVGDARIPARYWNNVCWFSSLWNRARQVMETCEKGVSMEPRDGDYHDTRGLARALTSDITGAIDDFSFFVAWTADAQMKEQRSHWIKVLKDGGNPFTPAVLQTLLQN